jgi:hypothetical protein
MSEEGYKVKVYEFPAISSYKDLLRVRQTSSTMEGSKSLLSLNGKNILSDSETQSLRLPQTKSSVLNNLNFDFGSLHEFIDYDMKLKKPEELFKSNNWVNFFLIEVHEVGRRHDSKLNNPDYLKEKLMAHTKQEVETRDMKTVNAIVNRLNVRS